MRMQSFLDVGKFWTGAPHVFAVACFPSVAGFFRLKTKAEWGKRKRRRWWANGILLPFLNLSEDLLLCFLLFKHTREGPTLAILLNSLFDFLQSFKNVQCLNTHRRTYKDIDDVIRLTNVKLIVKVDPTWHEKAILSSWIDCNYF